MNIERLRSHPWTIPGLMTIASLGALIAAIAADGVWDFMSCAILGLPVLVIGLAILRPQT